jgi:hypothetical protein
MITKKEIIEAINQMPGDEIEMSELKQVLDVVEELNNAEEDIKKERVYTNEQMKEIIETWRQSSGQILPKAI